MKLIPFEYKDQYPEGTFRYWTDPDNEDGYFYEIYAQTENKERVNVVIENFGVRLECENDGIKFTDIEPQILFPDRTNSLEWKHIKIILLLIIKGEANAKTVSKNVVDEWYQEWKDLGCP